jgi:hypothetical protein
MLRQTQVGEAMRQVLVLLALLAAPAMAARAPKGTIHGRSMQVMNDAKPSDDEMWAFSPDGTMEEDFYPTPWCADPAVIPPFPSR